MIKIIKNGTVTNIGSDQAWLDRHIGMGTFGSPRYYTASVEISPAVLGSEGVEISPAVYEDQQFENEGGYEVEIVDTTAQDAQNAINAEAEAYLDETDKWATRLAETGVAMPEGVSAARAAARLRIIR